MKTIEIPVNGLPLYRDGSDGSLWQVSDWCATLNGNVTADVRFVRVYDVIALLASHGISLVVQPADSSSHGTVIEPT